MIDVLVAKQTIKNMEWSILGRTNSVNYVEELFREGDPMDKYSLKEIWRNDKVRDYLHYVAVYSALLLAWVPAMGFFHGDLAYTAITVFFVFVLADKAAHWIFKPDKKKVK